MLETRSTPRTTIQPRHGRHLVAVCNVLLWLIGVSRGRCSAVTFTWYLYGGQTGGAGLWSRTSLLLMRTPLPLFKALCVFFQAWAFTKTKGPCRKTRGRMEWYQMNNKHSLKMKKHENNNNNKSKISTMCPETCLDLNQVWANYGPRGRMRPV